MKTRIKGKEEEKELVFELTRDRDGCVNVEVNGKMVVQFVNGFEDMTIFTNFESNYKNLKIIKDEN